jgi:hypothetical protein
MTSSGIFIKPGKESGSTETNKAKLQNDSSEVESGVDEGLASPNIS